MGDCQYVWSDDGIVLFFDMYDGTGWLEAGNEKFKILLDRMVFGCYNSPRDGASVPVLHGPLAQLVRASGS